MKRYILIKIWAGCMDMCNTMHIPMNSPIRKIRSWAIRKLDLEELQAKWSRLPSILS